MKTRMKKVFLFAPDWVDFASCLEKNLRFCGFSVTTLNRVVPPFRYRNFRQQFWNFIRKTFFKDHSYKKNLQEEHILRHQFRNPGVDQYYDYALIVRADLLSIKELKFIKAVSSKMISFHFDGMDRYPEIFDRIEYFDRFFVFDIGDTYKYPLLNLTPITNFYFDYPVPTYRFKNQIKPDNYDFYYLGTYHKGRIEEILRLQQFLSDHDLSHQIELVFPKPDFNKITPELADRAICMTEMISFEDYLSRTQRSRIMLDFVLQEHGGLSFRMFESIYYEKKLITTNKYVVNYDFYHPDNIFILDGNYEDLIYFLNKPYQKLPLSIRKKYGFTNWIRNILTYGSFDKITIPNYSENDISKHYHTVLQQ